MLLPVHFATFAALPTFGFLMTRTADASRAEHAIDVRFGQVGMVQVRLHTVDTGAILDELTGRVAAAPQFFDRTAVCVDLSEMATQPDAGEMRGVFDAIRRAGMLVVGVSSPKNTVEALAQSLDVPVISQIRPTTKPPEKTQPQPTPAARPSRQAAEATAEGSSTSSPALMHTQPVRSGQRIYARDRDLVLTTTVGAGAEVMADGCVHVYGSLRGRAMAGARGDVNARVFCQEFNAELVSIAGVFRVFETIPPDLAGKPVQAWLDGDDLRFGRIGHD